MNRVPSHILPLPVGYLAIQLVLGLLIGSSTAALSQTVPPNPPRGQPQIKVPETARTKAETSSAPAKEKSTQAPVSGGGEIIARVGGTELKEDEVKALVAGLNPRDQAAIARDPSLLAQMIRILLANQLALKEAEAKHWDQKPEVAAAIAKAREATIIESYLRSVSVVPADFPDQETLQSVYDQNKSAMLVPRQFQIAQLYVTSGADGDKAAEEKARKKLSEVQAKLKQPSADFDAVARADSDAKDAAEKGGAVGWVPETQLRPEIKAAVIGMAKGMVSEPIKLEDGWHFVKLIDTKPASTLPLADVKDQLVQRLREERANAMRRAYLGELLKKDPPAINELALSKVVVAPTP